VIRQALILAAGKGTRMLELTKDQAKPMIQVCGRSLIYRIMDLLVDYGIEKIVINTFYEAEKLEAHIMSYDQIGKVNIEMVREEELLETGGGIINMLPHLAQEPFFVANGDALWVGDNIFEFLNNAWLQEMSTLFLLFNKENAIGYRGPGDFSLDSSNRIIADANLSNKEYVFAGAHIATHNSFARLPVKPTKLMHIYNNLQYHNMYGAVFNRASFLHVGDKNAVEETERFLLQNNR
jgi:MurNAc alpha-1-phosphate uridylyltransferase